MNLSSLAENDGEFVFGLLLLRGDVVVVGKAVMFGAGLLTHLAADALSLHRKECLCSWWERSPGASFWDWAAFWGTIYRGPTACDEVQQGWRWRR